MAQTKRLTLDKLSSYNLDLSELKKLDLKVSSIQFEDVTTLNLMQEINESLKKICEMPEKKKEKKSPRKRVRRNSLKGKSFKYENHHLVYSYPRSDHTGHTNRIDTRILSKEAFDVAVGLLYHNINDSGEIDHVLSRIVSVIDRFYKRFIISVKFLEATKVLCRDPATRFYLCDIIAFKNMAEHAWNNLKNGKIYHEC